MKPLFVLICLLGVNSSNLFCQDLKITYVVNINSVFHKLKNGNAYLYHSVNKSLYQNENSQIKELVKGGTNTMIALEADKDGHPVYKLFGKDSMYSKVRMPFSRECVFQEPIPKIKWTLIDSTKTILGKSCKAAVGVFGKRVYFAWYAPSISISNGPHRLGGLPGLILTAHTTDGFLSYECIGIENYNYPIFYNLKSFEHFTSVRDYENLRDMNFKKKKKRMDSELDENGFGATVRLDPNSRLKHRIEKDKPWID